MHFQQALTLRNGPELVDNFYLLFPFMAKAFGVGCFIWSYKELDFFRFLILFIQTILTCSIVIEVCKC